MEFLKYGIAKLHQILPWMTSIRSTGRPTDLNVSSNTAITKRMVRILFRTLSFSKDFIRS